MAGAQQKSVGKFLGISKIVVNTLFFKQTICPFHADGGGGTSVVFIVRGYHCPHVAAEEQDLKSVLMRSSDLVPPK